LHLTKKEFCIYLTSAILLFITQLNTIGADNETSGSISSFDILNRSLNSVQKVDLSSVPTIGSANFSSITNRTIPILESFVLNDNNYTLEKANAENVTLPLNVQEIRPPSKTDNTTVKNYLIDQSNISKVSGINANDSCIVYSTGDSGQKQSLNFCNPPDVQIAPGKDHVIEMTNNFIGVWNKSDILLNKTVLKESTKKTPIYWTNNFFKVDQKNDTFDPSIMYDPSSHRWFSTLVEFEVPHDEEGRKSDKMGILLSYSAPDNSAPDNYKRWTVMKFSPRLISPTEITYFCPDRPMIHTSSDKVLISMTISDPQDKLCDEKNTSTRYLLMAIFNKTQLLDDTIKKKDFNAIKVYDRNYHYVPVKSNLEKPEINLVNISPYVNTNLRLSYLRVEGTLNDLSVNFFERDLDYPKQLPPNALQKGTNTRLYLADNRILDAVETNDNETWLTFHNDCNTGDKNTSCIRLIELTVDNNSPLNKLKTTDRGMNKTIAYYEAGNKTAGNNLNLYDTSDLVSDPILKSPVLKETKERSASDLTVKRYLDFQIGSDNYYYYYPTIAVSKNGSLVVYFGFSSENNYPSLGLLVLNTNSLSQRGNSVDGPLKYDPILVKNGTTFAKEENIVQGGGCDASSPCTRYGDYFSIKTDPYNDAMLWAAGEYYDDKYFSTVISNIILR